MKPFSTAFCLLVTVASFAQQMPQPASKDNTIIVQAPDSAKVVYQKLKRLLLDNQYTILSSDEQLLTISAKTQIDRRADMTVNIYINPEYPTKIKFFGNWHSEAYLRVPEMGAQIEYRKMGGSYIKDSWRKMDELAKSIPKGSVSYMKN